MMLIHRKGVSMKELTVDGSKSGRVLAGELTTWDKILSKEVKTVAMVLYGFTGMPPERVPPDAVRSFNMMVGRVVAELDESTEVGSCAWATLIHSQMWIVMAWVSSTAL